MGICISFLVAIEIVQIDEVMCSCVLERMSSEVRRVAKGHIGHSVFDIISPDSILKKFFDEVKERWMSRETFLTGGADILRYMK